MNAEFTNQLYAEFPYLYRGRTRPTDESSMHWGFECGDGWFLLIRELSRDLMLYLENHPELDLEVTQVKSKFGTFRFHVRGGDDGVRRLVLQAQERAGIICELSGKSLLFPVDK